MFAQFAQLIVEPSDFIAMTRARVRQQKPFFVRLDVHIVRDLRLGSLRIARFRRLFRRLLRRRRRRRRLMFCFRRRLEFQSRAHDEFVARRRHRRREFALESLDRPSSSSSSSRVI